ncbi:MAG TPA: hypothetical protein VMY36_03740 [Patescibacteria group bacterium]|nr:hypothetical protein [Patescibacteria group bacterium]
MSETIKPTSSEESTGEIARISAEQNARELEEMGIPPELSELAPGAKWIVEHSEYEIVMGHIDEDTGDVVIDSGIKQ